MADMKYKVGDKVKVRSDLVVEEKRYYMEHDPSVGDVVNARMKSLAGKVVTISGITSYEKYCIEEMGYNWTDEMFEGYAEIFNGKEFHLEAGMFGVMSDGDKFVVSQAKNGELYLVYQNGGWDNIRAEYREWGQKYYIDKLYDIPKVPVSGSREGMSFSFVNSGLCTPIWTMDEWKKTHAPKKMTVAEIEKELGYAVEVVKG